MGQPGHRSNRGSMYRDIERFDETLDRDDARFRRRYGAEGERRAELWRGGPVDHESFEDRRSPHFRDRYYGHEWDQGHEAPRDDGRPPWYDQAREYGGERSFGGVHDYSGDRDYGRPRDFDIDRAYSRRPFPQEQGEFEPYGGHPEDFGPVHREREDLRHPRREPHWREEPESHPHDRALRPRASEWDDDRDEGRWRPGPGPGGRPEGWPRRRS